MKRINQPSRKRQKFGRSRESQSAVNQGPLLPDWRELVTGAFVVAAVLAPKLVGASVYAEAVSIGSVEMFGGVSIVLVAVLADAAASARNRAVAAMLLISGCLAYCLAVVANLWSHLSPAVAAPLLWMLWSRVRAPADVPAWSRLHYLMVAEVCMASWVALLGFVAVALGLASLSAFTSHLESGALSLTGGAAAIAWGCYFILQSLLTPNARRRAIRGAARLPAVPGDS